MLKQPFLGLCGQKTLECFTTSGGGRGGTEQSNKMTPGEEGPKISQKSVTII
jgi:hypothetical protein